MGDPCSTDATRCDPKDDCNRFLVCAAQDPRPAPERGGCPISRASFKQDIRYLTPDELARYGEDLLRIMVVATVQRQAARVDAQEREITRLRREPRRLTISTSSPGR